MAKILDMPKLSPTMEEGVLATWHKKEGDAVGVDDLLAEVETDKATMEFRAFDKGTLLKILVPAGSQVKLGQPVAILGNPGEDISSLAAGAHAGAPRRSAAVREGRRGSATGQGRRGPVRRKVRSGRAFSQGRSGSLTGQGRGGRDTRATRCRAPAPARHAGPSRAASAPARPPARSHLVPGRGWSRRKRYGGSRTRARLALRAEAARELGVDLRAPTAVARAVASLPADLERSMRSASAALVRAEPAAARRSRRSRRPKCARSR